jgi:hypothetical protein
MRHPDFWIVSFSRWCGDEYQTCAVSGKPMSLFNETLANSLSLISQVYGQIGKVTAIRKVRYGPRDADKTVGITSGHNDIRVT